VECNQAAADLLNMPLSEILGQEVMDLFGDGCQSKVFDMLLQTMEIDAPSAMDVTIAINDDDDFTLAEARLAVEQRPLPGTEAPGVLMLFQPKEAVATKKTSKRSDKDGKSPPGNRRKGLHGHGGWKTLRDNDLQREDVELRHLEDEGPQDPMNRMLYQLCAADEDEGEMSTFTMQQLRRWLLRTPIEERPECIAQLNPWHKKKLKRCFDGMDTNGDGEVDKEEFFAWWSANVSITIVTTKVGVVAVKDEAQQRNLEVNVQTMPASPEPPPPTAGVSVQLTTLPAAESDKAAAKFTSLIEIEPAD